MSRCALHVHSYHSYDSLSAPEVIVERAVKHGVDYLVISDHETFSGSIEARAYAKAQGYQIEIPYAAEFRTDVGDVVVYGLEKPIDFIKDHKILCKTVKDLGGYTFLPHPYQSHQLDEIDYSHIDGIEVFNSRLCPEKNAKGAYLCRKEGKIPVYSSDAHFVGDMLRVLNTYSGTHPLDEHMTPYVLRYTPTYRLRCAQMVKLFKRKNWKGMPKTLMKLCVEYIYHLGTFKRCRVYGTR